MADPDKRAPLGVFPRLFLGAGGGALSGFLLWYGCVAAGALFGFWILLAVVASVAACCLVEAGLGYLLRRPVRLLAGVITGVIVGLVLGMMAARVGGGTRIDYGPREYFIQRELQLVGAVLLALATSLFGGIRALLSGSDRSWPL
jgi:hypothetical protein